MTDKDIYNIFGGVDLNRYRRMGNPFGTEISGGPNVHWQNPICANHGFSSLEHILSYRRSLWGSFFVTRTKSNLNARRVYSAPADRSAGIICDQSIMLNGYYSHCHYPEYLRRIRFKDTERDKTLIFLTNNMTLPALTIAALYKSRWQIELFFKWIKQHLRIKRFYGTSENAVKTQIWIAVSMYVLIAIIKKKLNLDASLYTLLQILSITLFEKMPLQQAFQTAGERLVMLENQNQLNLFTS